MSASRDATSPLELEHFVGGTGSEECANCDVVGPTGVMLESQTMNVNPNGIELSTSMKKTEGKGGQVALLTTRITSDQIEMRLATKGVGKGQGIFWGNLPNGASRKRKIGDEDGKTSTKKDAAPDREATPPPPLAEGDGEINDDRVGGASTAFDATARDVEDSTRSPLDHSGGDAED